MDDEVFNRPADVLVVDDNLPNRELMRMHLTSAGYEVRDAPDGPTALALIQERPPDLVLLDIMMPGMSGYEVCHRLRELPHGRLLPVLMVTSLSGTDDKAAAADAGADDFISKPVLALELLVRVRSLLRIKRLTDQLDGAETCVVALAKALEARDPYTEGHSQRVSLIAAKLSESVGMSAPDQEALTLAGLLHDVGKIGINDSTLWRPGPLDERQWRLMRQHPIIGVEICKPLHSLQRQLLAIRHHHERWDGRGYPDGLSGEDIPLGARVIAVADTWDALTSDRPYRARLPCDRALEVLRRGSGTQWDARMVECFLAGYPHIIREAVTLSEMTRPVPVQAAG